MFNWFSQSYFGSFDFFWQWFLFFYCKSYHSDKKMGENSTNIPPKHHPTLLTHFLPIKPEATPEKNLAMWYCIGWNLRTRWQVKLVFGSFTKTVIIMKWPSYFFLFLYSYHLSSRVPKSKNWIYVFVCVFKDMAVEIS